MINHVLLSFNGVCCNSMLTECCINNIVEEIIKKYSLLRIYIVFLIFDK